jgi:ribonuclease-3
MDPMELGVAEIESPEDFARRLGLPFLSLLLLRRALTHRSYLNEHPEALEDNERLEFLGDAVLDFLVGAWLYNRFPEMREGELTRLRSALVRTEQLAEFASQLNFGAALRLGRGESQAGGRKRTALLCATFEAVVGALYIDSGFEAVQRFIGPMLDPASQQVIVSNRDQDAKSRLQELVQAKGYGPPQYRTMAASGPEHSKIFDVEVLIDGQVLARGKGSSKQSAAQQAAQAALDNLDLDSFVGAPAIYAPET